MAAWLSIIKDYQGFGMRGYIKLLPTIHHKAEFLITVFFEILFFFFLLLYFKDIIGRLLLYAKCKKPIAALVDGYLFLPYTDRENIH